MYIMPVLHVAHTQWVYRQCQQKKNVIDVQTDVGMKNDKDVGWQKKEMLSTMMAFVISIVRVDNWNDGVCNFNCPSGQFVKWEFANSGSGLFECVNCPQPKGNVHFSSEEYCHACKNTLQGSGYYCADCGATGQYAENVSKQECDRCNNRYFNEEINKCLLCPSELQATSDGLGCE